MPTSVSRAAGLALTKALSREFAADNILVNAVCIGKIKAGQHERTAASKGRDADDLYREFAQDIPWAGWARPRKPPTSSSSWRPGRPAM